MKYEVVLGLIGIVGTISSIIFGYLAIRRNERQDQKSSGKAEGVMISDIGYIKACVDRLEKNLTRVDEEHRKMSERLSKVEEAVSNVTKRVDSIEENK